MSQVQAVKARRGGREARKILRAAPIAEDKQPIRAGMESHQRYKPLSDLDMQRIHRAALDVLEQVGFAECLPSTIEYLTGVGCVYNDNGRITFPRALVEDYIARARREFLMAGRDPKHDMYLKGSKVHFGTAGATVNMVNPRTGAYRGTTLNDLYDCARLADTPRQHPLLPAHRGPARAGRLFRDGLQHLLCQPRGNQQACRDQLWAAPRSSKPRSR